MEEVKKHANGRILDVDENPKKASQWIILAIQHVLARFVACITVPRIVFSGYVAPNGSSLVSSLIAPTILSAGIGSLIYLALTKLKSPRFLASSFAYISPMLSAVALGKQPVFNAQGVFLGYSANLWGLPIGRAFVGLVYIIVSLIIRFAGVNWLNKLLPTIVVGPVIRVIGLGLSTSAVSNLRTGPHLSFTSLGTPSWSSGYNLIALLSGLVARIVTALCSHYGKKTVALIPFVLGRLAGYVVAVVFTGISYAIPESNYLHDYFKVIDFTPIVNLFTKVDPETGHRVANITIQSFLDYPRFLFLPENWNYAAANSICYTTTSELPSILEVGKTTVAASSLTKMTNPFSASQIGSIALLFLPVSFVTICEHIGDHKNRSEILQRDLLKEPGLTKTLRGDGIATAVSGRFCGAANTTYGENVAVVGVTKVASVRVLCLACFFSILLSFISPLRAITETIPSCVTGGVSLLLYGFIAASGVKRRINEHVDMGKTKNIFVTSVILVAGIGGLVFSFGPWKNPERIKITSTAAARILGIIRNLILKEKPAAKEEAKNQ